MRRRRENDTGDGAEGQDLAPAAVSSRNSELDRELEEEKQSLAELKQRIMQMKEARPEGMRLSTKLDIAFYTVMVVLIFIVFKYQYQIDGWELVKASLRPRKA
eukprot:tig00020911_g15712.t1